MKKFLTKRSHGVAVAVLSLLLIAVGVSVKNADFISTNLADFAIQSQPGMYQVVEIVDGDTIAVKGTNGRVDKVRFIGIDTPEKNHPSRPVQCFSYQATDHLKELIGSSDVKLEADPTNTNRDRYDRLLRYVYLPDGTLLNARQIGDGYAFAYVAFPFTKMDEFRQLEDEARQSGRGLWGSCDIELDNGYMSTNPI
jgi:endonuclease YncB( thermonuclease family)